jgi:hypothetical protein
MIRSFLKVNPGGLAVIFLFVPALLFRALLKSW